MITHDEAKESQSRLFDSYIYGDFIPFPTRSDLDTIKEYIEQQEQFAKDVARYFELQHKSQNLTKTYTIDNVIEDYNEFLTLKEKLTKGVRR